MSDGSLIVNLGDISKPATVLIEKISDAVGGLFEPYQITRVAKAEAEAERIRAESQIEITDLHRRAFHRFLNEEAKKQQNIEEIARKALPQLGDDSQPERVEDDWIVDFFDKSRLVSDEEMQTLWSRVLAGEANNPGSYSKRTISILASLDKRDAQLFTELCTFGWSVGTVVPLVYDVQDEVYGRHGVHFNALQHLESIGLVKFDNLAGFRRLMLPKRFTVFYYGQPTTLELGKETDNDMDIGHVLLTRFGHELAPVCGSVPDPAFREYVLKKWVERGYLKLEEPGAAIT